MPLIWVELVKTLGAKRSGFAAGCEAGLCPAVKSEFPSGLRPRFGLCPKVFWARGRTRGIAPILLEMLRRGGAPPHIRRRSRNHTRLNNFVQSRLHYIPPQP